jgi:hypothetical protein
MTEKGACGPLFLQLTEMLAIVYFPYSRLTAKSRKYGKIINLSERSYDR